MSDTLSVQHPPALRVGGRRLSISARPRAHNTPGASGASPTHGQTETTETADYPRPATQGETVGEGQGQAEQHAPPPPHEEEPPKKEKKHGHGAHDQNRLKESAHRKLDATMPSKDCLGAKHSFGAAGRIGQPMGKALAV